MKDLIALTRQLKDLALQVHANQIPSTDEDGGPVWIDGSGLNVAFDIMKIGRDSRVAGRETTLADFPPDLLKQIGMWTRAELTPEDAQVARITKELCQQILARLHLLKRLFLFR